MEEDTESRLMGAAAISRELIDLANRVGIRLHSRPVWDGSGYVERLPEHTVTLIGERCRKSAILPDDAVVGYGRNSRVASVFVEKSLQQLIVDFTLCEQGGENPG